MLGSTKGRAAALGLSGEWSDQSVWASLGGLEGLDMIILVGWTVVQAQAA